MKIFTKKRLFTALIIILAVLAFLYFRNGEEEIEYFTETTTKGDILQVVSVNGTVESEAIVDLSFQKSGRVATLPIDVGQRVNSGDLLGNLDNVSLQLQAERSKTSLDIAIANLNLALAGPEEVEKTLSDIAIKEAEVNLINSEAELENLKTINTERVKQAELAVSEAELAVSNAEIDLQNQWLSNQNNTNFAEQQLQNTYNSIDSTLQNSIDSMINTISFISLLAEGTAVATSSNTINSGFVEYIYILTAKTGQVRQAVRDGISVNNQTINALASSLNDYRSINPEDLSKTDVQNIVTEINSGLSQLKELINLSNEFVDDGIENLPTFNNSNLTNTISPILQNFKTRLTNFTTNLTTQISNNNKLLIDISNAELDVETTKINNKQQISAAESKVENAKKQLELAKSELASVKATTNADEDNFYNSLALNELQLAQAQANFLKLISDPRSVEVAADRARVNQAEVDYQIAQKDLADTIIYAPADGVITDILIDKGENVTAAQNVIKMIADQLVITANIPETDINKISVGNEVEITLDSLPISEIFQGKVVSIDPAETVIQGVIYYQTEIAFNTLDPRIKSGMTSNLEIITEKKSNILTVPSTAVEFDNNQPFVNVLEGGQKVRKDINIGISSDTVYEVLSGLEEGEEVILFEQ